MNSTVSKESLDRVAQAHKKLSFRDKIPVPLSGILSDAKKFGVRVRKKKGFDWGFIFREGEQYIIVYNPNLPLLFRKFLLLHELAHCLLGHLEQENVEECNSRHNQDEANLFAYLTLMPHSYLASLEQSGKLNHKGVIGCLGDVRNVPKEALPAIADERLRIYQEMRSII